MQPVLHALGDSGITIALAEHSDPAITALSRATAERLRQARIPHVDEVVAAYTAVTVFYDSLHASFAEMEKEILRALALPSADVAQNAEAPLRTIPVKYDGPDLESVAAATGLTVEQVIETHSAAEYTVDLLGFVPGFAYMSELDKRLELPRREQPRPRVPAGSVAIAARLTGVYPFETPGGWHILGRTREVMFDPRRPEPSLLKAGERVKFVVEA
jgi:KipI family sensor histidine kinase inhibitor